ncbi:MAG: HEPN domain-containing protein [Ferruginibacter sp.]|nr:HEPN domain-containing protein [Ferruginibacter sp.]
MKNDTLEIKNYVRYKIVKSNHSLRAASLLIKHQFYNEAISRLYYACFYLVKAYFFEHQIDAKTHEEIKDMMRKHLVETNAITENDVTFFCNIFEIRHSVDYGYFIDFDKKLAQILLTETEIFIINIKELIAEEFTNEDLY